jgi:hypothetical protein
VYQKPVFNPWSLVLVVAIFGIGVFVGGYLGEQFFVHQNCIAYPFLLLNPNYYVACRLP